MSFNKNQINSEEQKDERMLYRPQIWRYKYKSCLEKPLNLKDSYDPDTMNSLKNLIKSTSFEFSQNRFENRKESTRYQSPPYESSNTKIRVNQSQQNLMPQWLKFDKNVLKFTGYFVEHVTESAYENYRIRACNILYYLEDDAIHVVELKSENSGIVQGDLIKRRRIQYNDLQDPTNKKDISWKDLNLQKNVIICGKNFRICSCDKFTQNFFEKNGIPLNQPEKIPEYNQGTKYSMINMNEVKKNIMDLKEFTEVGLGGGHPNKGLTQFLENDRKVLRFDITWYSTYEKEEKKYKLHYYLADGQIEVCEIKVSNSGKDPFPRLLRKSKLPKIPRMVYCPGLISREEEYYTPKDLVIGNYVYVYNRKCLIVGCDEFTSNWYREK
jgi:hypothetical protein